MLNLVLITLFGMSVFFLSAMCGLTAFYGFLKDLESPRFMVLRQCAL